MIRTRGGGISGIGRSGWSIVCAMDLALAASHVAAAHADGDPLIFIQVAEAQGRSGLPERSDVNTEKPVHSLSSGAGALLYPASRIIRP